MIGGQSTIQTRCETTQRAKLSRGDLWPLWRAIFPCFWRFFCCSTQKAPHAQCQSEDIYSIADGWKAGARHYWIMLKCMRLSRIDLPHGKTMEMEWALAARPACIMFVDT
jgi:hypothetical protein